MGKNFRRPAQAPVTWIQTIITLSKTLRFTYSETLGKWPIDELALGIEYLIREQVNLHVESEYAGNDSVQLKGPEIIAELNNLLRLLSLCKLFSKKKFHKFLKSAGYSEEEVLFKKTKGRILKPAFTIIRDKSSKCFLLLIRGTHSIKDALTAVTGAVVPFHHSVLHDGGISNLVLGAHRGMVAAAWWIAKHSTPCLLKALGDYPDYNVKIVGHSLGGGTAALLTNILREQKEFSSCTCFAFAPAACMTWDLADLGKHFINTLINGSDLVPTFSTASIDDLHSEVMKCAKNDDKEKDKELISADGHITKSNAENITEGELRYELEKELKRQDNKVDVQAHKEEAEIMEEENVLAEASDSRTSIFPSHVTESLHLYPPGRIMHIVSVHPPNSTNLDGYSPIEARVGIYETPRKLYNKIRLSKKMIDDHYMRSYENMILLSIEELEKEGCNRVKVQEYKKIVRKYNIFQV